MTRPALHPVVCDVTERIRVRSAETRRRYLERIGWAARRRPARLDLGCANLAHGFAACESSAKDDLRGTVKPNVAIVSSYNDMLSAHQPYETFPRAIKGPDGSLVWRPGPAESLDPQVLRPITDPFTADGGLCVLRSNLGRAVIKVSAVARSHRVVTAPARVFDDQAHVVQAFARGELDRDVVVVMRYQGPRANGMPELHKLTPSGPTAQYCTDVLRRVIKIAALSVALTVARPGAALPDRPPAIGRPTDSPGTERSASSRSRNDSLSGTT